MEPPRFIVLGASVLRSILEDESMRGQVDAEFVRRLRMNQADAQDLALVQHIHDQLVHGCHREGDGSLLEGIRSIMLADATWASCCVHATYLQILKACPHILGPLLGVDAGEPITAGSDPNTASCAEAQYGRISNKLKKIRALEEARIGYLQQLSVLLRECGERSPHLLQTLADGALLVDDAQETRSKQRIIGDEVISREQAVLHDLLALLEADLKCEDVFWKWLLPSSSSASANGQEDALVSGIKAIESMILPSLLQGRLSTEAMRKVADGVDQAMLDGPLFPAAGPSEDDQRESTACIRSTGQFAMSLLQHCAQTAPVGCGEELAALRASNLSALEGMTDSIRDRCPYTIVHAAK